MSVPYICTYNFWIEIFNGQFKGFIKNDNSKTHDELQIVLNKSVYYNNKNNIN